MRGRLNKILIGISIFVVFASSFCGCKKSVQTSAKQEAIEKHEQDIERHEQKVLSGTASPKTKTQPRRQNAAWTLTGEAQESLLKWLKSGKLPDVEDARLIRSNLEINLRNRGNFSTNYPVFRTFRLKMKTEPFFNFYKLVKDSATSPWQLQQAWRTDAHNKTVRDYPVSDLSLN